MTNSGCPNHLYQRRATFSLAPVSAQLSLIQAYSNATIFADTIPASVPSSLPVGGNIQTQNSSVLGE